MLTTWTRLWCDFEAYIPLQHTVKAVGGKLIRENLLFILAMWWICDQTRSKRIALLLWSTHGMAADQRLKKKWQGIVKECVGTVYLGQCTS